MGTTSHPSARPESIRCSVERPDFARRSGEVAFHRTGPNAHQLRRARDRSAGGNVGSKRVNLAPGRES